MRFLYKTLICNLVDLKSVFKYESDTLYYVAYRGIPVFIYRKYVI